jgi:hypothetical protein
VRVVQQRLDFHQAMAHLSYGFMCFHWGERIELHGVSLEIADKEYGNGNSGYANIQAHVDDKPIEQIEDVIDAGLSLFMACWEVILGVEKFRKQLEGMDDNIFQLAAELLYVQQFFTSLAGPDKKIENVRTVLNRLFGRHGFPGRTREQGRGGSN